MQSFICTIIYVLLGLCPMCKPVKIKKRKGINLVRKVRESKPCRYKQETPSATITNGTLAVVPVPCFMKLSTFSLCTAIS